MRKLLILPVLFLAVAFAYPLVNEGDTSSCAALEKRALTLIMRDGGAESILVATIARNFLKAGKGRIAREFSRQRNPDVPVSLACTMNYWHSVFDREWLVDAFMRALR